MRKYIQRDLSRYVDFEKIDALKRTRLTQKAERSLQSILRDLLGRLKQVDMEVQEKNSQLQTMEEVLKKYRRKIAGANEEEEASRKRQSRKERVLELDRMGMSQRNIAEMMGISQPRVNEIIKRGDKGVITLPDQPNFLLKILYKKGLISREDRDCKIREWRGMGYTQEAIAKGVGLSRSRVSQILLAQCTQVQKTNTKYKKKLSDKENIFERAQRNGFHRNTQRKIEQIRKVAPKLAKQCEAREVSVSSAYREVWDDLVRLDLVKPANPGRT